jgi:hypothetical protein
MKSDLHHATGFFLAVSVLVIITLQDISSGLAVEVRSCADEYFDHDLLGPIKCFTVCNEQQTEPPQVHFCWLNCPGFWDRCLLNLPLLPSSRTTLSSAPTNQNPATGGALQKVNESSVGSLDETTHGICTQYRLYWLWLLALLPLAAVIAVTIWLLRHGERNGYRLHFQHTGRPIPESNYRDLENTSLKQREGEEGSNRTEEDIVP